MHSCRFIRPSCSYVSDEQFELYKDVVTGAYRFHDMMLARLLELAGPDTTVILVSDHGFQSRDQRPQGVPREPAGPAAWHREYGIFVAKGPGIKRDERDLWSVTDRRRADRPACVWIADWQRHGRPAAGGNLRTAATRRDAIPSWEEVPGECGMHGPDTTMKREDSDELLKQFVALGYIEDPGDDKEKAAENAEIEAKYNLSRSLLWTRKSDKAIELMEDVCRRRPWETRFLNVLAHAYHASGYHRQAERLILATYQKIAYVPTHLMLILGEIKLALGEMQTALGIVRTGGATTAAHPAVVRATRNNLFAAAPVCGR